MLFPRPLASDKDYMPRKFNTAFLKISKFLRAVAENEISPCESIFFLLPSVKKKLINAVTFGETMQACCPC